MEYVSDVRESLASAKPFSACVLAYGESFVYSEGYLCYFNDRFVRVLYIHGSSRCEEVIELAAIEQSLNVGSESFPSLSGGIARITSLSYSERVLVCVCEAESLDDSWLLVIDLGVQARVNGSGSNIKRRLPFRYRLGHTTKLFVRHNRSYLYYGTHSGLRPDGHHEWLLTGLDLEKQCPISEKPFRLLDFVGSDIGSTACFTIYRGFLFAVSNQTSFEAEEVDWTSYYFCIKIPLGETKPDLKPHPIWQRQHGEGPINDSWTDLSLQVDYQTNELIIVECRREWLGGGSANMRTYYTQPLRFGPDEEPIPMSSFPPNDPLTRTLDENSKPHFSKPRKRIRRNYHREYEQSRTDPPVFPPRDFILAKTHFRAYVTSAMSFVDLVSDPEPLPGSRRMRSRLRLRIASRRPKSPLIPDPERPGQMLLRQPERDEDNNPIAKSEEDFHPTQVHLWPPDNAAPEIYDVLCHGGTLKNVEAMADEKAIIYATDLPYGDPRGSRAIVVINFDPSWGRGLKTLTMPSGSPPRSPEEVQVKLPNKFPTRPLPKRASISEPATTASTSPSPSKRPRIEPARPLATPSGKKHQGPIWQERAMYLSINHGYRLRW